jgi:integrase
MSNVKTRGDGSFTVRGETIWVQGSINGKFIRKSTGKKATKMNLAWVSKQRPLDILSKILSMAVKPKSEYTIKNLGYLAIEESAEERSPEVQADYISIFERLIIPFFEKYELEDIGIKEIESWEKVHAKLSPDRRRRIRRILNSIMKKALKYKLINENPFIHANPIKDIFVDENEVDLSAYTTNEIRLILDNSEGWLKVYFSILFTTGMRVGEALGLEWSHIDFDKKVINLKQSLTQGKIKLSSKQKNHRREVYLMPEALNLLQSYAQEAKNDKWIFVSDKDKPHYDNATIVKNHVKPLFKAIGVEYKTVKATRKSYVSIMYDSHIPESYIQANIGHAIGSAVTKKFYYKSIHNNNDIAVLASQELDKKIGGSV